MMKTKKLGYRLFQVIVVSTQVACVVIAIHDEKSVFDSLIPSILTCMMYLALWVGEHQKKITNASRRLYMIPKLLMGDMFVLIIRPNDIKKEISVHHNFVRHTDLTGVMAFVAIEVNKVEQSLDTLTNELGIKRADE